MKTELVELQEITKTNSGILRPQAVVEYAKNPETALHSHFTWDDSVAAHSHRLWQARQLIRVSVTVMETQDGPKDVKAFVSLTPDRSDVGGGYRVLSTVLNDAEQREQLLEDALAELNAFKCKYQDLKELSGVMSAIKKTAKKKTGKYSKSTASKRKVSAPL